LGVALVIQFLPGHFRHSEYLFLWKWRFISDSCVNIIIFGKKKKKKSNFHWSLFAIRETTKGFIRQPDYNDTIICLGSSNDFLVDENARLFGRSMMVFSGK
jgi:hypothetical protein